MGFVRAYFLICVALFCSSCTNPKNTKIPADHSKWEAELKPHLEKLSDEDKKLVAAYLVRTEIGAAFGAKAADGDITIGKAIELQRAWQVDKEKHELEEKALKEKLEADRLAIQRQIDGIITVTVLQMRLEKSDFRTKQLIKLGFKNKGDKDISGIKGEVHFIDMFDKEVGSIKFGYTDGLKAGATAKWEGTRDFNQFIPEHRALASLEEGKYSIRFQPEMIVFKDGTKLASPD